MRDVIRSWLRGVVQSVRSAPQVRPETNEGDAEVHSPEGAVDPSSPPTDPFVTDAPVHHPEQDRFRRWLFAQRVAQTIANREDTASLAVGIYGDWGEGKTSVLNFIKHELDRADRVVCIRYNPWRYQDEDTLLKELFSALATALRHSIQTRAERMAGRLGGAAKAVPPVAVPISSADPASPAIEINAGEWLASLATQFSTRDLEEYRRRIDAILRETRTRVVVLMDDIDRLDRQEIQTVFRLVKLTADFSNTVYVLAFDPGVVADAIGEKYATARAPAGYSFLEKIIQVPLHLPAVSTDTLREYCFEYVDRALAAAGIELSQDQVNEFVLNFQQGLEIRLRTPRMASRYGNILAFSLPVLKGEVYAVDLMLIEGVRLFYPTLYETIRNRPELFLSGARSETRPEERERIKTEIENGFAGLNAAERDAAQRLVTHLFPRVEGVFRNNTYGSDWDVAWTKDQRVASSRYFPRYFAYAIPEADVADSEVEQLLASSRSGQVDSVRAEIERILHGSNAAAFVERLRHRADSVSAEAARPLALAIATMGESFPDPDTLFSFRTPRAQAVFLLQDLTARVSAGPARMDLAKAIVRDATPLAFAAEYARSIRVPDSESGAPTSGIVSGTEREALRRIVAERIRDHAAVRPMQEMGTDSRDLLLMWARWGNRQETNAYVKEAVTRDPASSADLLSSFTPTAWGMESGLPRKSDFEREQYDALAVVVDPDVVYQALGRVGGINLRPEHYPHDGASTSERIAEQFAWMHVHVTTEAQPSESADSPPEDDMQSDEA